MGRDDDIRDYIKYLEAPAPGYRPVEAVGEAMTKCCECGHRIQELGLVLKAVQPFGVAQDMDEAAYWDQTVAPVIMCLPCARMVEWLSDAVQHALEAYGSATQRDATGIFPGTERLPRAGIFDSTAAEALKRVMQGRTKQGVVEFPDLGDCAMKSGSIIGPPLKCSCEYCARWNDSLP